MKNNCLKFLFLLLVLFPINIYAYSNRLIIGGETIGIEAYSKGIYIVGFYDVDNKAIAKDAGFKIGDIIEKIDNVDVGDISDINKIIKDDKIYSFKVLRNNKYEEIKLYLSSKNDIIKTGLYVKDKINGIGTLSYIDPETKVFASLGHEILESNSMSKFNISTGTIYKAEVTNIKKSKQSLPGEKNADIEYEKSIGEINKNEISGIYGKYNDIIDNKTTVEVGKKEEIRQGNALIKTVVEEDKKEDFKINILSIDEKDPVKNIFFEITDNKLLNKTNGIVQGMSGSPIIQNNKIIGVVNYVVLNDTKKGYGIFIETMLKEGDKLN